MPKNYFYIIPITNIFIIVILKLHLLLLVINSNNNNVNCATLQCLPCDQKLKSASYEEFEFEHQVTKQEAIHALKLVNNSFFDAPRESACKAISCSPKTVKYCLGSQFLNDHCWCEQGHSEEGLPFVPHTCYVGDKQYGASVGSCYFYREVKRCCCLQVLAQRWKHLSSSSRIKITNLSICLPLLILFRYKIFKIF